MTQMVLTYCDVQTHTAWNERYNLALLWDRHNRLQNMLVNQPLWMTVSSLVMLSIKSVYIVPFMGAPPPVFHLSACSWMTADLSRHFFLQSSSLLTDWCQYTPHSSHRPHHHRHYNLVCVVNSSMSMWLTESWSVIGLIDVLQSSPSFLRLTSSNIHVFCFLGLEEPLTDRNVTVDVYRWCWCRHGMNELLSVNQFISDSSYFYLFCYFLYTAVLTENV